MELPVDKSLMLGRRVRQVRPQLTFFQAGVDPHEADAFGKLKISSAGLKRRNRLVCVRQRRAIASELHFLVCGSLADAQRRWRSLVCALATSLTLAKLSHTSPGLPIFSVPSLKVQLSA
uniref:Uncharacterized protein n=1 Tax=Chrysotila carterae TaxID=13221 RepID=A0A7S4B914_CHRCT